MATGKSGYVEFASTNASWATVRIYWSETYDVSTNTSTVTVTSIRVKSTKWHSVSYYFDGILRINGVKVDTYSAAMGTDAVYVYSTNEWYTVYDQETDVPTTATLEGIKHNSDGSKSVTIELLGYEYSSAIFLTTDGESGNGWKVGGTKTITLTNIPRASTIGASDANIGSKSTVVVTRRSSSYKHSIAYSFGDLSGYITASGGVSEVEETYSTTTISWTIPEEFYGPLNNAQSGICTLTVTTYSGDTQIGEAQTCTLRVTVAKTANAPDVSGTVVDSNASTKSLTGDETKFVRYFSTALCTIEATAKSGATISVKKIGGVKVTEDTRSISKIAATSIAFYAKDSRGYETTKNVALTLIPYVLLTNNAVAQRTDPVSGNAQLILKGDYFNGSFGAVDNELSIKYRYRAAGGTYSEYITVSPNTDAEKYTATVALSELSYEESYDVEVVVSDKLSSVTKVATVPPGIPIFDWGKDDFRFNVPVSLPSGTAVSLEEVQRLLDELALESSTAVFA